MNKNYAGAAFCGGAGVLAGLVGIIDKQMSWRGVDISDGQAIATGLLYMTFGIIILWLFCLKDLCKSQPKIARRILLTLALGALLTMVFNTMDLGALTFVSVVVVSILMSVITSRGTQQQTK